MKTLRYKLQDDLILFDSFDELPIDPVETKKYVMGEIESSPEYTQIIKEQELFKEYNVKIRKNEERIEFINQLLSYKIPTDPVKGSETHEKLQGYLREKTELVKEVNDLKYYKKPSCLAKIRENSKAIGKSFSSIEERERRFSGLRRNEVLINNETQEKIKAFLSKDKNQSKMKIVLKLSTDKIGKKVESVEQVKDNRGDWFEVGEAFNSYRKVTLEKLGEEPPDKMVRIEDLSPTQKKIVFLNSLKPEHRALKKEGDLNQLAFSMLVEKEKEFLSQKTPSPNYLSLDQLNDKYSSIYQKKKEAIDYLYDN